MATGVSTPRHQVTGRASIVVLNWNGGALLADAVSSATSQTWGDVEVIVVDNASTDDSVAALLAAAPDTTVVYNTSNLGFSGGMNTGVAAATGEFVLPLNCDAQLEPDYVETLVSVLRHHPAVAGAGGRVTSGRVGVSGPLAITNTMRTRGLPADEAVRCDKVNGACPLFRGHALDQVVGLFGGPYDGTYDTYGEDVDLALTLGSLGWEYWYEPAAGASHVRSFASAPKLADRSGRLRVNTIANRHRNIVRHADRWVLTNSFAVVQDVGFAVLQLVKGDLAAPRDVWSGLRRHAQTLRADVARRRQLGGRHRSRLIVTPSPEVAR